MQTIRSRIALIGQQPHVGIDRSDLRPGVRTVVIDSYVVYYRLVESEVQILDIRHGSQSEPSELD